MSSNQTLKWNCTPQLFLSIVHFVNQQEKRGESSFLSSYAQKLSEVRDEFAQELQELAAAKKEIEVETVRATKHRAPSTSQEFSDDSLEANSADQDLTFLSTMHFVIKTLHTSITDAKSLSDAINLTTTDFISSSTAPMLVSGTLDGVALSRITTDMQLNKAHVDSFVEAMLNIDSALATIFELSTDVGEAVAHYYGFLHRRHTVQGVKVHGNPIATDVALTVFKNTDAHGEISREGRTPDTVSAFTVRKAVLLADAVKQGYIAACVADPSAFIALVQDTLKMLWDLVSKLRQYTTPIMSAVLKATRCQPTKTPNAEDFSDVLEAFDNYNPRDAAYREPITNLTKGEKLALEFQNETLDGVVTRLTNQEVSSHDVIQFILERKNLWRQREAEENSFYVCRLSSGDQFKGESPGMLTVVRGERPEVDLSRVRGSGFQEVRSYLQQLESEEGLSELFVATSPASSGAKDNVLLVGPPGCLHGDTHIPYEVRNKDGSKVNKKGGSLRTLYRRFNKKAQKTAGPVQNNNDVEFFVTSFNKREQLFRNRVTNVVFSGTKKCYRLRTKSGKELQLTADHELYTGAGEYVPLSDLTVGDTIYVDNQIRYTKKSRAKSARRSEVFVKNHPVAGTKNVGGYIYKRLYRYRAVVEANMNGLSFVDYIARLNVGKLRGLKFLSSDQHVHHKDEDPTNDDLSNLVVESGVEHNRHHSSAKNQSQLRFVLTTDEISSIEYVGKRKVYDIQVENPHRNFIAAGIAVHNCGKTEAMRAVGGLKNSIAISASGSDFLTAWKGEAEKNPKRLWLKALEFVRLYGRRVHIIIDEIDTILHEEDGTQQGFGGTNLVTEFLQLMDGIDQYPLVSLWGATNHVNRLSPRIQRRFQKVIIVGELTQDDRQTLLQQYFHYLPTTLSETNWKGAASLLEDAVGDVIRKVSDTLWRAKMAKLVADNREASIAIQKWIVDTGTDMEGGLRGDLCRTALREKLREYFTISANEVEMTIRNHLANPAIQEEVKAARKSYREAHDFVRANATGGIILL